MRLLLDTNVVLRARARPATLSDVAATAIAGAHSVFVSAASLYEIAYKVTLGKLRIDVPLVDDLAEAGYEQLPVTWAHGVAAARLPLHHRDPFDRILIAQAQLEGLTVMTRDRAFADYGIATLAA